MVRMVRSLADRAHLAQLAQVAALTLRAALGDGGGGEAVSRAVLIGREGSKISKIRIFCRVL